MFLFRSPSDKLRAAAHDGDLEAVKKLLEVKGININEKNSARGETALIWAALRNHPAIVTLLLKAGADCNIGQTNGHTPLIFAAANGHIEIVQQLLDAKAYLDIKDAVGNTALIYAAIERHLEIVQLLIDKGADCSLSNNKGKTALTLAEEKGYTPIAKMLKDINQGQQLQKPAQTTEDWSLLGNERVAFTGTYPEIKRKLTEIFNFSTRKHLLISKDLETSVETIPVMTDFDELPVTAVQNAFEHFKRKGGHADEDFVLQGTIHLDKGPAKRRL